MSEFEIGEGYFNARVTGGGLVQFEGKDGIAGAVSYAVDVEIDVPYEEGGTTHIRKVSGYSKLNSFNGGAMEFTLKNLKEVGVDIAALLAGKPALPKIGMEVRVQMAINDYNGKKRMEVKGIYLASREGLSKAWGFKDEGKKVAAAQDVASKIAAFMQRTGASAPSPTKKDDNIPF